MQPVMGKGGCSRREKHLPSSLSCRWGRDVAPSAKKSGAARKSSRRLGHAGGMSVKHSKHGFRRAACFFAWIEINWIASV